MKKASVIIFILTILLSCVYGQSEYKLLRNKMGEDYRINKSEIKRLQQDDADFIIVQMPNHAYDLELQKLEVVSNDFVVKDGNDNIVPYIAPTVYYGTVLGKDSTFASISINTEGELLGIIEDKGNRFILDTKKKTVEVIDEYSISLPIQPIIEQDWLPVPEEHQPQFYKAHPSNNNGCQKVRQYLEASHKMYKDRGNNVQEVTDYVLSAFAIQAALYDKIEVDVDVSELKVWTVPDPYEYTTSASALYGFRDRMGQTGFNGDLAHLLSTESKGLGGVAYLNTLCATKKYRTAFSNISNSFSQLPIYSWTIGVITHETGHNLGSPHTHSCTWDGGPLDNCYGPEGSCAPGPTPVNGGTIMSYCHLTSHKINLAKGFHPSVANLIYANVSNAPCLGDGDCGGDRQPNLYRWTDELVIQGSNLSGSVSIANNGDQSSKTSWVNFYLSSDNQIGKGDQLIGKKQIPVIVPNAVSVIKFDFTPSNVAPGEYYLGYVIDADDEVTESNEQDNTYKWAEQFIVSGDGIYCESIGKNSHWEAIGSVKIGDRMIVTGDNGGYGNFVDTIIEVRSGTKFNIELEPKYRDNVAYPEEWSVWVDFNDDKDFDDDGEFMWAAKGRQTQKGKIEFPNGVSGNKRMRVQMMYRTQQDLVLRGCTSFSYGEVEDYTLSFQDEQCDAPILVSANIDYSNGDVVIKWNDIVGAAKYEIRYRERGNNKWTVKSTKDDSFRIKNLQNMEYQVRADCGAYGEVKYIEFN